MKISKVLKWSAIAGASLLGGGAYAFFWRFISRPRPAYAEDSLKRDKDGERFIKIVKEEKAWLKNQKPEHVSIQSFDGLTLRGIFLPAEGKSEKVILGVHGITSCSSNEYAVIARFFHEQGYHFLMVDDRAHGESDGKYAGFGCLDREDCYRWVRYLDDRFNGKYSIFLHGVSMGAATVLMTSSMNLTPNVKGIIADCGYTSPMEEFQYCFKRELGIKGTAVLKLSSIICRLIAGYGYSDFSTLEEVKKTKIPIFIIHGKEDDFVPTVMGRQIYDACVSEKRLWLVDGAAHARSYYVAREEYEEKMLDFMEEHL
ncbi:alpha/beta hydrolase [Murimonas intestini]|uniref:alpha/beta hydrolase n=1 Tax=Murimonas intestini TaxID=1337051 RepID=UPI0011DE1C10|nr:alpha/beta hydrolase [Murimonas intestini]